MRSTPRQESRRSAKPEAPLPQPGKKKKDPRELDKLLDKGVEDSMVASDPPAVAQPEVHTEPGRDEKDSKNKP